MHCVHIEVESGNIARPLTLCTYETPNTAWLSASFFTKFYNKKCWRLFWCIVKAPVSQVKQIMQEIVSKMWFLYSQNTIWCHFCATILQNFCLCHFVLEVCCTSAKCVYRNKIFANRLLATIEYTFDLAVRNVERLNVLRFVTGMNMFQPRYY